MAWHIKRENGHEGNYPYFGSDTAALDWINNNTGYFDNNEVIALIDWEDNQCYFVKLELTIIARVL